MGFEVMASSERSGGLVCRGFLVCRREALNLEYHTAGSYVFPEKADANKDGAKAEAAVI